MPDGLSAQGIPFTQSDRDIILLTHSRQEVLIEQVTSINGRLRLTERLAWTALGGVGLLAILIPASIGVWSVIVAMR